MVVIEKFTEAWRNTKQTEGDVKTRNNVVQVCKLSRVSFKPRRVRVHLSTARERLVASNKRIIAS